MGFVVAIAIGLWFWFGSPGRDVASWFWPAAAAPWEKVDAFYYPDRSNLTVHRERTGLGSLDECRSAVRMLAAEYGVADTRRGDYECGVGLADPSDTYGMRVYRITVK